MRSSAPAPDSRQRDAPGGAELREGDAGELLRRVREDSQLDAAGRERLQGCARRGVTAQERGSVILGEPLEQRAPVPRGGAIERVRGVATIHGKLGRVDLEDASRGFQPGRPERPCVPDRVELDGERACGRHARRRARADCQSTIPMATPTASIATSTGAPCRPETNV